MRCGTGSPEFTNAFWGAHTVCGIHGSRTRSTKKSANLHQAAESSVEIFSFGRSLSRTSTLAGQGTLPSPTTGCRIRLTESLLMLPILLNGVTVLSRFVTRIRRRGESYLIGADLRRLLPASLSILKDSRPGTHGYDSLKLKVLSSTRTPQSSSCPFCRSIRIQSVRPHNWPSHHC